MPKSAKEYVDEIFSKTGVAISPHDPVMVVKGMLELFFSEVFSKHEELYTDLKSHVDLLKIDADALDANRRQKFLDDVDRLQRRFLSELRTESESMLSNQRTTLKAESSQFSQSVSSSMRSASEAYEKSVNGIFWFTVGNVSLLGINLILFIRSL